MHSFPDLGYVSASFTLAKLEEVHENVIDALQNSGTTSLVKTLQMIRLQKAIAAVGMFSLFESILQDRLEVENGFKKARELLDCEGERALSEKFNNFLMAINVLKHGTGRGYDMLLTKTETLLFRIRRPEEDSFFEGDVSELSTLVEVDDGFIMGCAEVIRDVSNVIRRACPGSAL